MGQFLSAVTTSASIRFPSLINAARELAAVRVTDLTSKSAPVAEDTTGWPGTRTGTPLPLNCAVHLSFKILRRYRGGKPRISLPWLDEADTDDGRNWISAQLNNASTAFTAHVNELKAAHGAITVDQQVSVGYYQGFTVVTKPPSNRAHNVPNLKTPPSVDDVVQIVPHTLMGSSRRRLKAHTGAP